MGVCLTWADYTGEWWGRRLGKDTPTPAPLQMGRPHHERLRGGLGGGGERSGMGWGIEWGFERDHSVGGMRLGLDIWV